MPRFRFPLETVERWRKLELERAEAKLENLIAQQAALLAEQQAREAALQRESLQISSSATLSPQLLTQRDAFARYVHARRQWTAVAAQKKEQEIAQQRIAVLEARRAYELLLKLRQRAFAAWQAAQDKAQETLAAETYLARWRRSTSERR